MFNQKTAVFWAFSFILFLTALRILALAITPTDLFVDEAQYWFWGQNLDFGYYSKPPLIAWLIRLVTELANSSEAFWVRIPAPLLHGLTAALLGVFAARRFGSTIGAWVSLGYVSLPIVAVGSFMISTDTVLAPFYVLALIFYDQANRSGSLRTAAMAGAALGVAFMAKYAALYLIICMPLIYLLCSDQRLRWAQYAAFFGVFLTVIAPNIIWNLANELTTLSHTAENVQWVKSESQTGVSLANMSEFLLLQAVVIGPVAFAVLGAQTLGYKRFEQSKNLLLLSVPIVFLITVQAGLSRAYANWAFPFVFAGITLAMAAMGPRLRIISLVLNTMIGLIVTGAVMFADIASVNGRQIAERYLHRSELSRQIAQVAKEQGIDVIVAQNRDVLADLFHTLRAQDFDIRALRQSSLQAHYYAQKYPFERALQSPLLMVSVHPLTLSCKASDYRPLGKISKTRGAYRDMIFNLYRIEPGCQSALLTAALD